MCVRVFCQLLRLMLWALSVNISELAHFSMFDLIIMLLWHADPATASPAAAAATSRSSWVWRFRKIQHCAKVSSRPSVLYRNGNGKRVQQFLETNIFSVKMITHSFNNVEVQAPGRNNQWPIVLQFVFFYPRKLLLKWHRVWDHSHAEKWNCCQLIQVGRSKSDPQHHCLQCSQKHDEASTVFYRWLYLNQKFQFWILHSRRPVSLICRPVHQGRAGYLLMNVK